VAHHFEVYQILSIAHLRFSSLLGGPILEQISDSLLVFVCETDFEHLTCTIEVTQFTNEVVIVVLSAEVSVNVLPFINEFVYNLLIQSRHLCLPSIRIDGFHTG
jgi:hypothetical protein